MLSETACLLVCTLIQYDVSRTRTIKRWFCIAKRFQQFVLGIEAVRFQNFFYRDKSPWDLACASISCQRRNKAEKDDVAFRFHCKSHPFLSTNYQFSGAYARKQSFIVAQLTGQVGRDTGKFRLQRRAPTRLCDCFVAVAQVPRRRASSKRKQSSQRTSLKRRRRI